MQTLNCIHDLFSNYHILKGVNIFNKVHNTLNADLCSQSQCWQLHSMLKAFGSPIH